MPQNFFLFNLDGETFMFYLLSSAPKKNKTRQPSIISMEASHLLHTSDSSNDTLCNVPFM
jgi:hypothetical protein